MAARVGASIRKLLNLDKSATTARVHADLRNTCVSGDCRAVECIELGIRRRVAAGGRALHAPRSCASYAGACKYFYVQSDALMLRTRRFTGEISRDHQSLLSFVRAQCEAAEPLTVRVDIRFSNVAEKFDRLNTRRTHAASVRCTRH